METIKLNYIFPHLSKFQECHISNQLQFPQHSPLQPSAKCLTLFTHGNSKQQRTQSHYARDFRLSWSLCFVSGLVTLEPPSFFVPA
jgi:hypothetical protein